MNTDENDKNRSPLKIAMVGYLNTVPLVYGLKNSTQKYDLHLEIPSKCYDLYENSDIDVALLPVGVLPLLPDAHVITDYCIGCISAVRTVCLFSNSPIKNVKTVYLDKDSRTSVLLTRILINEHWGVKVVYIDKDVREMNIADLENNEAVLMIGDKVFEVEDSFDFKYDLGKEWFDFSGNPFAFAVWVAKSHVSNEQIEKLNTDLEHGASSITEALQSYKVADKAFDLVEYFDENIDYNLDNAKRESMKLFLSKIEILLSESEMSI